MKLRRVCNLARMRNQDRICNPRLSQLVAYDDILIPLLPVSLPQVTSVMKIRIAYYSWQGHTEKVAKALAEKTGAELARIEEGKEYGMGRKAMMAIFGMRAPIRQAPADLSGIDLLVVASPVWCGKVPPYVNEYCSSVTGGKGKKFHVLVEMGGRAGSAIRTVRKRLEAKGMIFGTSASTIEKDVESGAFTATVEAFAASIMKG
jgi:flavodoxin